MDVGVGNRIEFLDVVVDLHQGFAHLWTVYGRCIAQHTHLGLGIPAVAEGEDIVDDARKLGMQRRFAISGEGKRMQGLSGRMTCAQHVFEGTDNRLARRAGSMWGTLSIGAALAVDTVEAAQLAIARHKVDAQRNTQSAAVDRTKNWRGMKGGQGGIHGERREFTYERDIPDYLKYMKSFFRLPSSRQLHQRSSISVLKAVFNSGFTYFRTFFCVAGMNFPSLSRK